MRILIVTYYWPPAGGGGVQRWVKFAKYLHAAGHSPIIYTPENPDTPISDNSLESDIPEGIEVIKKKIFEPSRVLKMFSGKSNERIGASGGKSGGGVSNWVRGNMFIPDARVGWVRPSVKFLSKWLEENKVDALITTGPPHSMHLIGRGLKQKIPDLKWMADFRDPWSDMDYLAEFAMGDRAKAKMLNQEQSVVQLADKIIVTSKGAGEKLTGEKDSPKVSWIPNGWDPSDFPQSRPQADSVFRIGHFGALHGARNSTALWSAVSQYNKISEKQIQLVFAGHVCDEVNDDLKRFNLQFSCTFLGNLAHKKAVEEMMTCSALLLIHNDTESATRSIPGKLFEYLATGVPIVSICRSNSDLSDILDQYDLPHSEHDDDMAAVAQLSGTLTQQSINASPFKREELTKYLIKELEELIQ